MLIAVLILGGILYLLFCVAMAPLTAPRGSDGAVQVEASLRRLNQRKRRGFQRLLPRQGSVQLKVVDSTAV